ncbi:epididymal-specific lipocalin-12 [Enhydra lutris kenyoni]|uniref:Epididymal-specific lipocalin-12 n=1 Tax=Enhydra lutris kenyoni TaxID=391180 RepID=A0A2Y9J670_ENHLU|nr:epididymal-specific lipocalin-12 [Enhydra lutris kenyoni]
MGPCCALWAVLTLLKGLKGQTSNTQPGVPSVLRSFQEDQFQGEWFVVGLAGSTHRKMDRFLLTPFTAVFEQNKNSHLEVSYAMTRGHRCVSWSYVLIPAAKPGGFSVESREEPEEVQVYDTDYSVFALMLFRRQSSGQSVVRVNLLCRMWTVQTMVLDKFVCLLQALGLSDDNVVFPDLTGNGPSGSRRGRHLAQARTRHGPAHGPREPYGSPWGSAFGNLQSPQECVFAGHCGSLRVPSVLPVWPPATRVHRPLHLPSPQSPGAAMRGAAGAPEEKQSRHRESGPPGGTASKAKRPFGAPRLHLSLLGA